MSKPSERKTVRAPLEGEKRTVEAMIEIYCRKHHDAGALCPACRELQVYAFARVDRCPFGPDKPKCSKCHVHCYTPEMRERIRNVMSYAGPRMAVRHPILSVAHALSGVAAGRETRGVPTDGPGVRGRGAGPG